MGNVSQYQQLAVNYSTELAVKLFAVILFWIVGRWLIGFAGPVLAVRPFCHNDHYWQVYFDGNRTIRESLAVAGFPSPMPAQLVLVQNQ